MADARVALTTADAAIVTATFVGNASGGGNHFGNFAIKSGRTRVRATFGRATLGIPTQPPTGSVIAVAGHAVVGFSTTQPLTGA